jgi:hypothetical protein
MTISKRNKPIRLPANDAPHALLTAAEARGEAAFLVLSLLLPELPQSMCKRVMVRAHADADSLGIGAITEEVETLFAKVPFEPPLR